jgi:hypothetical protein
MIKRSLIVIGDMPVTVRELTVRDLLDFELGNAVLSDMWVLCDMCGLNPYEMSDEDKNKVTDEFAKLNKKESKKENENVQNIIDVAAMLITRGHVNVLDYGVTFVNAAIESIKDHDEIQAQIRLTTTAIGTRGTADAMADFKLYKKEKTPEEIIKDWENLETML